MFSICTQIRYKYLGIDGGGRLHDCLPEWRNTSQENAWLYMDEKVLPNDRQKVITHQLLCLILYDCKA